MDGTVAAVGEEHRFILDMVAEGKITPEEALRLLEAIDEGERTAEDAAKEQFQSSPGGRERIRNMGAGIEQAVKDGLRSLEDLLDNLEDQLGRKLDEVNRRQVWKQAEERIRRAAEQAVSQAERAEQRAAAAAEAAARKAAEAARRAEQAARRFGDAKAARRAPGEAQVAVERIDRLRSTAAPGSRLVAQSRTGDISVAFYDGSEILVEAVCRAWGRNQPQAQRRLDGLQVALNQEGTDIVLTAADGGERAEAGSHVRVDYRIQAPHGTDLSLDTQVGDLQLTEAQRVGRWELTARVGDIDVEVSPGAGFCYTLETWSGEIAVSLDSHRVAQGEAVSGSVGDGSGEIRAFTDMGDIRVHY